LTTTVELFCKAVPNWTGCPITNPAVVLTVRTPGFDPPPVATLVTTYWFVTPDAVRFVETKDVGVVVPGRVDVIVGIVTEEVNPVPAPTALPPALAATVIILLAAIVNI
jgi:hypothetical protein